jgi:hypothetical protein
MKCPHCQNDDDSLIEKLVSYFHEGTKIVKYVTYLCTVCARKWTEDASKKN